MSTAQAKPQKAGSTQKFTDIVDIIDNVVLLRSGAACAVIEVEAVNFALLSKEEQDAKIYSYASLLNSLSFPIQILIRNKRVDISSYLKLLSTEAETTQNPKLAGFIRSYREFVQELVKVNSVLDKNFYITIPYSSLEKGITGAAGATGHTSKTGFFPQAQQGLHTKLEALHAQLNRLNLRARTLGKEELVKLFFDVYNQEQASTQTVDTQTPIVRRSEA